MFGTLPSGYSGVRWHHPFQPPLRSLEIPLVLSLRNDAEPALPPPAYGEPGTLVLEPGDTVSGAMFYKVAQQWLRKEGRLGRGARRRFCHGPAVKQRGSELGGSNRGDEGVHYLRLPRTRGTPAGRACSTWSPAEGPLKCLKLSKRIEPVTAWQRVTAVRSEVPV